MKIERLKSYILIILIIISMSLSWYIWTYTPSYETIENIKYIQEVQIGRKKLISEVIVPKQVLLHKNNKHYRLEDTSNIKEWGNYLRDLEVKNIKRTPFTSSFSKFLTKFPNNITFDTVFPDIISSQTLDLMLKTGQPDESFSFDMIRIEQKTKTEEQVNVFFINTSTEVIYQGELKDIEWKSLEEAFALSKKKYSEQIPVTVNRGQVVYIPKGITTINKLFYITEDTEPELFKEALFTDPKLVRKNTQTGIDIYTDGTRLLKVYKDIKQMQFINPVNTENIEKGANNFSADCYNFINDHGGFNQDYYYEEYEKDSQSTVYRLHYNDLPVLNKDNADIIKVQWGKDEVISYQRPLFKLSIPVEKEFETVKLPSGEELLAALKKQKNIDSSKIEDIAIAYNLIFEKALVNVVRLEPIWAIKYEGVWMHFKGDISNGRGSLGGLE